MSEKLTTSRTPPAAPDIYPGDLVGLIFGMVFVVVNSAPLAELRWIAVAVAAVAAAFALIVFVAARAAGYRGDERLSNARPTTAYLVIVGIEVVLLFGGLAVLRQLEPSANLGWIAVVVGTHFIAFARWWLRGVVAFAVVGMVITLLGVIGLAVAFTTGAEPVVDLVSGVGSGLVLVGSAAIAAARTLPRLRR